MNNPKLLRWVAFCLLISNVGLLGFFFFQKKRISSETRQMIIERLHLDKQQIMEYDAAIKTHQVNWGQAEKNFRNAKKTLYQHLNMNANQTITDSLLTNVGAAQIAIERIHFAHFVEIRKLCKPEQQARFQKLTKEITSLFNRPPKQKI